MTKQTLIDRCIKNKQGKLTLFQAPNWTIIGWAGFKVLSYLHFPHSVQSGFSFTSTALLFTWAYLELTSGVNYFRKVLGFIVLLAILVPHF